MKRNIFTLIELLIVIAIISILASLLLPALRKAREKCISIVCTENLKQCGFLLHQYADDYSNLFPVCINTVNGETQYWAEALFLNGYLEAPKNNSPCIFVCPSYIPKVWVSTKKHNIYGLWYGDTGHGVLSPYVNDDRYYINRYKMEPERILVADSTRAGFNTSCYQSYMLTSGTGIMATEGSGRVIHLRHSKKGNTLFVDGHCSATGFPWLAENAMYNWRY